MTYIQTGAAIGFAVAAGVGTFILGMLGVLVIASIVVTIACAVGKMGDSVDDE